MDIGDIYQDTTNMASILLHRDTNGKVLVVRSYSFLMHPFEIPAIIAGSSFVNWRDSVRGRVSVIITVIPRMNRCRGISRDTIKKRLW